jgi:hypothetical protein
VSVSALPTPLAAFAESPLYTGPTLILAWQFDAEQTRVDGEDTWGLCIDDEGRLVVVERRHLRIDVRYDWKTHKWVDVNGVTEDDGGEDDAPDGRPQVPG